MNPSFSLDRHAAVSVKNKIYYFGGLLNGVKINDVYCLDTDNNSWSVFEVEVKSIFRHKFFIPAQI